MPDKWEDTQGFQKFKKDYYNDYFKNTKEIMNGNPFTFFESPSTNYALHIYKILFYNYIFLYFRILNQYSW